MRLGEADTRAKLIDPAIHARGWTEDLIRREETAGAVEIVDGRPRRQARGRVDHLLRVKVNPDTQKGVEQTALIWHTLVTMLKTLVVTPAEEKKNPAARAREIRLLRATEIQLRAASCQIINPKEVSADPWFHPDVIVVSSSGVEAVMEVKVVSRTYPNTPIVVAGYGLKESIAARAFEAGATVVVPVSVLSKAVSNLSRVVSASETLGTPKSLLESSFIKEFHDPRTGHLDARRITESFGISLSTLANALGLTPSALSKRATARTAQDGMRQLEFAWAALRRLLGSDDLVRAWLNAAHLDLDGKPPIALLAKGSVKAFTDYVMSALAGQPT